MRSAICLYIIAASLVTIADCEAGGFFRRVPDVGEWARFDFTLNFTSFVGKPIESSELFEGNMLVQCVGEETVGNERHLWIELVCEMKGEHQQDFREVKKLLVPEVELLSGALGAENVRGWRAFMKSEPEELKFSSDIQTDNTGGAALLYLVPGAMPEAGQMADRTVVVDDVSVELNYSETSPLPIVEYANVVTSGEITQWPHDDLGFGVASVDYEIHQRGFGDFPSEMVSDIRYDLVATGTDAVSELPEHS